MKLNMYSFLDEKSKVYSRPFYGHNDGDALRSFSTVVNDKQSMPSKFPVDFTLWRVGSWDDVLGVLSSTESGAPVYLAKAVDFVDVEVSK